MMSPYRELERTYLTLFDKASELIREFGQESEGYKIVVSARQHISRQLADLIVALRPNVDWDKPLRTRLGHEVRIYSHDGGGQCPVHGAIGVPSDTGEIVWHPIRWTKTGCYDVSMSYSDADLVNVA